jgi:dimethylargininase
MMMRSSTILRAILREPGKNIVDALSQEKPQEPINFQKALEQHDKYAKALQTLGVVPIIKKAHPLFPDGCFTEDTHLILPEVAIVLNPGAVSRAKEPDSLREELPKDRPIKYISHGLTIDGGDILVTNKRIYVGLSTRTTGVAVDQLKEIVSPYGYSVFPVHVPLGLHLKSGMTCIEDKKYGNTIFIIQKDFEIIMKELRKDNTHKNEWIEYFIVPETEKFAANVLPLNECIIIPQNCPITKSFLSKHYSAEKIIEVDTSEFRKVDGALTCLSIPYKPAIEAHSTIRAKL